MYTAQRSIIAAGPGRAVETLNSTQRGRVAVRPSGGIAVAVRTAGVSGTGEWCALRTEPGAAPERTPQAAHPSDARANSPSR
ncbi:unnamed protein product [Arctia plantaginis]|uniref:Uncharacterized protein n=1 Tax=Arctia plantaginis TaxID=874455 RepID=A0A8S1BBU8_ARCPL|nr:unnamed protein product [Arctia plantaginis]CAB3255268.1 unnamed protein product [Arctia plantaginis]